MKKVIVVWLLSLAFTGISYGQSVAPQDSLNALNGVIITYQAGNKTPVTFLDLYAKDMDRKNTGQEPSFILSETPSVTVYSDAGNTQGYSYYRLRGIDQTRINVTLDGVPLNEPEDQGAYFSNYPDLFNSLSRIQVQRGVGTSKNGSAAYAGSIQLFSPDAYDTAKTTIGLGYGSFNSFRVFGEYNSGIRNHKSLYVRASQVYSDGYKYHSANNGQSVFASTGLYYDKTMWKLNILAGHQQNELSWLGVADSLIEKDRRTNGSPTEKDRFVQALVQLQNNWAISRHTALNTSVYYTFLKGNYDFDLNNYLGQPSTEEMYNYAFQSGFLGLFSNYTVTGRHIKWITGLHASTYNRQHTGSERSMGRLYRNTGYKKELSLFSKAEWQAGRFLLFADAQYRHAAFSYDGSVKMDAIPWDFFNPKAGLSYELNGAAVLYYSIGRTSREPTKNDLFGGNDNLGTDTLGQPVLYNKSPESVTDQELGIRYRKEKLSFSLNGYYMSFKNEIVLDGKFGPNGLALTNKVDRSYRAGIELSLMYRIGSHWCISNNSSFNHSRIKEQSVVFTPVLTPSWIIGQEVMYGAGRWSAALSGRYQSASYIDFANTASVGSYLLLNARIGYTTGRFGFTGYLNNLTNARYFNNGYLDVDGSRKYFVQAPLNVYAAATYSF